MIKLDFAPIIGKPIQGLALSDIAGSFSMELIGEDQEVHFLNPLSVPKETRTNVLSYVTNQRFLKEFLAGDLDFTIIPTSLAHKARLTERTYLITDKNPRDIFTEVHLFLLNNDYYYKVPDFRGESNQISPRASIHPNVHIGNRCRIDDFAVIQSNTIIGDDVTIKAAAVIGGDGFGIENLNGRRIIVPHAGGVVLDDNTAVGSATMIDKSMRSAFTYIAEGTKLDNLIHIAHNVVIGPECTIVAHSEISGSVRIGRGVWYGPGSVCIQNIKIGDYVYVGLGSVITKDVPSYALIYGNPARAMQWVCKCQNRLNFEHSLATCSACGKQYKTEGNAVSPL